MIEVSRDQSSSQIFIYVYVYSQDAAAAAAGAVCVATAVPFMRLFLQQRWCCFLLLLFIVCRMVKSGAGSLNLIPVFSLSFIQTRFIFDVALGSTAVSHVRPRLAYILGNCGHARCQGGRQAATAKSPLEIYLIYVPGICCLLYTSPSPRD